MSCETPKTTDISDSTNRETVVPEGNGFLLEKADNVSSTHKDFQNFVDSSTFMACQENGGKIHPASHRED